MSSSPAPAPSRRHTAAWRLFTSGVTARASNGRLLCESFLELPDRDALPVYYHVIDNPVCVADIAARLTNDGSFGPNYSYSDTKKDIRRMLANAKRFNASESSVYTDAMALEVSCLQRGVYVASCSIALLWQANAHSLPSAGGCIAVAGPVLRRRPSTAYCKAGNYAH